MTGAERVQAVADFGFTERQARFLVLVMRHAGVCVPRQYARVADVANGGKKCNAFFDQLVARGWATANRCVHNRARLYHVHHKPIYHAIGEGSSRYRRPLPARLATERLMLLDAVLTMPNVEWLTTVSEKRAYVDSLTASGADDTPPDGPAGRLCGKSSQLPGAFPIGVDAEGRMALLYLATEVGTERFRSFLQVHVALLRAAPAWTVRLVFPRTLDRVYADYQTVIREELESPLHPATVNELKRFFEQRRQAGHSVDLHTQAFPEIATRGFNTPRFALLYRRWLRHGDIVLEGVSSPTIADALNAGRGTVESVVLPHLYRHLFPLAADDLQARAGVEKGATRGAATSGRPQPPTSRRSAISSTSALL